MTNSIGPALGSEALKNISYPAQVSTPLLLLFFQSGQTKFAVQVNPSGCGELPVTVQVLAKSCKMIPVMLMGTLIGGKFYSSLEYGCAIMIAAGISIFAQQSSSKVISKLVAPNAPLGYGLCSLNLFFDGYTNAMQVCGPHASCLFSDGPHGL